MSETIQLSGLMRAVGGTAYETVKRGDWDTVERDFTPLDLINVLECFELDPDRRQWVNDLLDKRLDEKNNG
jgi:hypothetical protein